MSLLLTIDLEDRLVELLDRARGAATRLEHVRELIERLDPDGPAANAPLTVREAAGPLEAED